MNVRTYHPEEITKIQNLGFFTSEEAKKEATTVLARSFRKPPECVLKRYDYELKQGNIKQIQQTIMAKHKHLPKDFPRYTDAEKRKIKSLLKDVSKEQKWKVIDSLAKELNRKPDAIYQIFHRVMKKKRKYKKTGNYSKMNKTIKHIDDMPGTNVLDLVPRPITSVNKNEVEISFSEMRIDMATKKIILILK